MENQSPRLGQRGRYLEKIRTASIVDNYGLSRSLLTADLGVLAAL
jgi:hypothetical protein